jgi:carboxyl-terminal processing protease
VLTINRSRGLALTTARYYTPSGRSIQRDYTHGLDDYYNPDDEKDAKPEGLAFKTDLGRMVYGGGGINPDYALPALRFNEFLVDLRFRHQAFFRFAVHEKERFGIKAGQHADEVVMGRFRAWALEQKLTLSDKDWDTNLATMQEQISIEMQNVAFGIEAGFKIQCEKNPEILKALEVLPEAGALYQKKLLLRRDPAATVASTH